MDEAARVLAECLRSWRRGPYPSSTSFVSAVSIHDSNETPRWMQDVHNIVDLQQAMEALTYRQREALYRYVVLGQGQRGIAGDMCISQQSVSIELETACKTLTEYL